MKKEYGEGYEDITFSPHTRRFYLLIEAEKHPDGTYKPLIDECDEDGGFKRRTSPPATLALLSAIGVFVLGGAVHTRALPSWYHLAASVIAVGVHLWALLAEWSAFLDNGRLMADPAAYVRVRVPVR